MSYPCNLYCGRPDCPICVNKAYDNMFTGGREPVFGKPGLHGVYSKTWTIKQVYGTDDPEALIERLNLSKAGFRFTNEFRIPNAEEWFLTPDDAVLRAPIGVVHHEPWLLVQHSVNPVDIEIPKGWVKTGFRIPRYNEETLNPENGGARVNLDRSFDRPPKVCLRRVAVDDVYFGLEPLKIPEGYEYLDFRKPRVGEWWLNAINRSPTFVAAGMIIDDCLAGSGPHQERIILRPLNKPKKLRIVLESTGEKPRTLKVGEYGWSLLEPKLVQQEKVGCFSGVKFCLNYIPLRIKEEESDLG